VSAIIISNDPFLKRKQERVSFPETENINLVAEGNEEDNGVTKIPKFYKTESVITAWSWYLLLLLKSCGIFEKSLPLSLCSNYTKSARKPYNVFEEGEPGIDIFCRNDGQVLWTYYNTIIYSP